MTGMDWFLWTLVGWWVFTAVLMVTQVGKPRKPLEPFSAAIVVAIDALLIFGLVATR